MSLDYRNSFFNILQENNQTGTTPDYAYSPFSNLTRCKGCNKNLTSNNPATRYQNLKRIQNTVRVPSSHYTMNIGALNVYQKPNSVVKFVKLKDYEYIVTPGVNWNQMSDRANPHIQSVTTSSGSTYGGNSVRRSITRLRPGSLSPGGVGVDIKHNSYYRYLARIKGKAPLRRGPIPEAFLLPDLPFNRAFPVYGSKLFKTSIVNNCNCPIDSNDIFLKDNIGNEIASVKYTFSVGDKVLALKLNATNNILYKAEIINLLDNGYVTVRFLDDNLEEIILSNYLKVYIPSNTACLDPCLPDLNTNLNYRYAKDQIIIDCVLPNYLNNGKTISSITQ